MDPLLSIVIPTRNRPQLALKAIQSVIQDQQSDIELVVSDNSDKEDAGILHTMVSEIPDQRIKYFRPDNVMSMAEHWEWAVRHAQGQYVSILSDRSVYKTSALDLIRNVIVAEKPQVVSFIWDSLRGLEAPYRYKQKDHSKKIFKFESRFLLEIASRSIVSAVFPRFLNSFIARDLLEKVLARSDKVKNCLAPDFGFCFRFLDLTDSIHFFDYPAFIVYGSEVSNGYAYSRNTRSTTIQDFYARAAPEIEMFAPIHTLRPIPFNIELLEYNLVKENQQSGSFVEVDKAKFYSGAYKKLMKILIDGGDVISLFPLLDDYADKNGVQKVSTTSFYRRYYKGYLTKLAIVILSWLRKSRGTAGTENSKSSIGASCSSIDDALVFELNHPRPARQELDRKALSLL